MMMSTWCSKHVEAYNKLIIKQEFVMMKTQCSKHVEEYTKLIIKQEFVD